MQTRLVSGPVSRPEISSLRARSRSHGPEKFFQISGGPGIGNGEAVSRASRGPALDGGEDGHLALCRDDFGLRFPRTAHGFVAAASPAIGTAPAHPAGAWYHRLHHHLVQSRLLRGHRSGLSPPPLFS